MLNKSENRIKSFSDIMITLAALELMAFFYYGIRAVWLGVFCMAVSLAAEFAVVKLRRKKFAAEDFFCLTDGLIIALMLPASINLKIAAAACLFGIIIGKNIFGGRENMIFSPAAAAYVFVSVSWGRELLSYPKPYTKLGFFGKPDELVSSFTSTFNQSGKIEESLYEVLMGSFAGPMGTVCVLIIAVAAAVLLARRGISVFAFAGIMAASLVPALIFPYMGDINASAAGVFMTNMTLFAAVYIGSDKRIVPEKWYLALVYGIVLGAVSYGLLVQTGKENMIVPAAVMLAPLALWLRKLSDRFSIETTKGADADEQN